MRECPRCRLPLPEDAFASNNKRSYCSTCKDESRKASRQKYNTSEKAQNHIPTVDVDKRRARYKRYATSHPEKMKAYRKKSYEKAKAKIMKRHAERRQELRRWMDDIKSQLKCSRCPESDPCALDFHHLDPSNKVGEIANLYQFNCKQRILDEISKCQILCANCHRKLHRDEKLSAINNIAA